jgi:ubiquinone/menaquinone biosynthesis C-methylase UbiE
MAGKIEKVKKFYDNETGRYLADRYAGETCEHFSYLARKRIVLDYLSGAEGKILDVGCGPAIFTKELLKLGLAPYSVDLSFEMLKKARSLVEKEKNTSWTNSEIERLPFKDNCFDNVMSIGVIAYADDVSYAVHELVRVLKPGGELIIQCSNPMALTPAIIEIKDKVLRRKKRWDFSLTKYRFGTFRKVLESAGLQVEHKRSYDFRPPFLEKYYPDITLRLTKMFQNQCNSSSLSGWIGEGYIVKSRKVVD